jgi:hypothetical protein
MILAICIIAYAIGFLLAFGLMLAIITVKKPGFGEVFASLLIALFSWAAVGWIIGIRLTED